MAKRIVMMLVLVGLVLGGIFGYKVFVGKMIKQYMAAAGAPTQTVSAIKATSQDWQPNLSAVGTMRAVNGADLSSEVAGIVEIIKFESGSDVEGGSVLMQLRAEDDIAKLMSLQAASKLAEINFVRDEKQLKVQAISQAALDVDSANLASAKAQVAEQQAIVDKKTIKAPFTGHLGIRQVDVGQYLNPGTAIVTLQQLDPIYADFNLPEDSMTQVMLGQKINAHVDAYSDKSFEGEITAINSKVDESTRNIQVRASFKNPDHLLLPGMFAKVSIESGAPVKYVTLPQTAITYNPYGDTVFVVEGGDAADTPADASKDAGSDVTKGTAKDKPKKAATGPDGKPKLTVKQSFVKIGETRGDQVAILSGINEGDMIVTSGQMKLRNGAPIAINNEIEPSNDSDPKPKDH